MEEFILKNDFRRILQVAAVFIGTIVGAGLASGQEITQFFSTYGYKSFIGIIICTAIYIIMEIVIIKLSIKHNLSSYKGLIALVSPGFLGKVTDYLTGFFLICSAAIILAGSGALFKQYFGVTKWVGILLMVSISLITLLRDTKGLVEVNSFIVPCLIFIISTIFFLYIYLNGSFAHTNFKNYLGYKKHWEISCLLYAGFNILCSSGVLVPLSIEMKDKRNLILGTALGSIVLGILCSMLNLMLIQNMPNIFKYDIPLLYIANSFGPIIELMLLIIIWFEMFSTEVSDIYSLGKTLKETINLSYKKSVILILSIAIPISQIGFSKLIRFLYPGFGVVSLVFMIQCSYYYFKKE